MPGPLVAATPTWKSACNSRGAAGRTVHHNLKCQGWMWRGHAASMAHHQGKIEPFCIFHNNLRVGNRFFPVTLRLASHAHQLRCKIGKRSQLPVPCSTPAFRPHCLASGLTGTQAKGQARVTRQQPEQTSQAPVDCWPAVLIQKCQRYSVVRPPATECEKRLKGNPLTEAFLRMAPVSVYLCLHCRSQTGDALARCLSRRHCSTKRKSPLSRKSTEEGHGVLHCCTRVQKCGTWKDTAARSFGSSSPLHKRPEML